jgi:hypothetical protein
VVRLIGPRKIKGNPDMVASAFKQTLAMRLRVKGHTYQDITDRLQLPAIETARELVMAGIRNVRVDTAEELRDIELTRLESLNVLAWKAIQKASRRGDTKGVATVLNSLVRLSDRRAKLMGLDAPVKYDLLVSEARKMAQQLNLPETEFMTMCETIASEAWGK